MTSYDDAPVSMRCRVGEHKRCMGIAWDRDAGEPFACQCDCGHPVIVRHVDAYRASCPEHGWGGPVRLNKDDAVDDADDHRQQCHADEATTSYDDAPDHVPTGR